MQIPADLCPRVRDVMEHLHDYAYLQTHPLVDLLWPDRALPSRERMRSLRTALLQALEQLSPASDCPADAIAARVYRVLHLHYVDGLTIQEAARELVMSERQVYRDLRKGEHDLAMLLWNKHLRESPEQSGLSRADLVCQEAERVRGGVDVVDLSALMAGAVAAVDRLSERHGVLVQIEAPPENHAIRTDVQLARQACVNALSYAVQRAQPGTTVLYRGEHQTHETRFSIQLVPAGGSDISFPPIAGQLVWRLGGRYTSKVGERGSQTLSFTLSGRSSLTVLIIDDNQGLVELFRRYLADDDYHLMAARDGEEGLRLAQDIAPDVIVLDVMMPQVDGWEVLQRLRNQESTAGIPIIVCSVLDDPELGFSLGATEFLAKPVSRSQLLAALERCWPHTPPSSHPTAPVDA